VKDGYAVSPEDRKCRLEKVVKKMQAAEMTFYVYILEQVLNCASEIKKVFMSCYVYAVIKLDIWVAFYAWLHICLLMSLPTGWSVSYQCYVLSISNSVAV